MVRPSYHFVVRPVQSRLSHTRMAAEDRQHFSPYSNSIDFYGSLRGPLKKPTVQKMRPWKRPEPGATGRPQRPGALT